MLFSSDATAFVEKLASIMALGPRRPGAGTKLIFTRSLESGDNIRWPVPAGRDGLPESGWVPMKVGLVEFWQHGDVPDIICNLGPEGSYEEEIIRLKDALFPVYRYTIDKGGLPLHSAMIARDGFAVVLAARGNTGKSTCCQRVPRPWLPACDDESLVLRTGTRSYNVHPFPTWSNFLFGRPKKSWEVQQYVPLKAIYFLEQANSDEAIPIELGEAASRIYFSCFQIFRRMFSVAPKEDGIRLKKEAFNNACEMSKLVPAYVLKVDLHGRFWEEIDRTLAEL